MKVYIEFLFLLNYLLDFMILYGTKRILKYNSSIYRLIIGSMIGSLTTFFPYIHLSNNLYFVIKIIISILMVLISFGKKRFITSYLYFYLISIFLGGFIYLFDISNSYLILIILFFIGIKLFIKIYSYYHNHYKNIYHVNVFISNKKYSFDGYLDTGNQLKSPISHKSVILVDFDIENSNYYYVPYKCLNSSGVIPCIKPDRIIIDDKEISNCLVGFSKDKININGCCCILPNSLKEEL